MQRTLNQVLPMNIKQFLPWIVLFLKCVNRHHGPQCSEGHSIAGKAGGDKLPLRAFSDVGKTVHRLNDLAGPSGIHSGSWNKLL